MCLPQSCMILLPASRDPVKLTPCTFLLFTNSSPISFPEPVTRFTTPFGSPASTSVSTSLIAISGVSLAGFSTHVFPETSAGINFQAGIAMGKFHGVIKDTTPMGLRIV